MGVCTKRAIAMQVPPNASVGPAMNPAAKPPRPPTLSKVRSLA